MANKVSQRITNNHDSTKQDSKITVIHDESNNQNKVKNKVKMQVQ